MTAWVPIVQYIANGEDVKDVTVNRPLTNLANRTQHLKEIVDQVTAGELLVIRDAVVLTGVAVGDWVYYDSLTQQYKQAISEVLATVGGMITGPRSFVVGVVVALSSPTVGLIVTGGLFRDGGGIFGALAADDYYLSETVPGAITNVLPVLPIAVPIFVAVKNSNATLHISIDTKDLINSGDATYSFAVTSIATANTNLIITGCEDGQPIPPGPLDPRTKDIVINLANLVVAPTVIEDGQVLKNTDGGVGFLRGWTVENLIAGAGIILTPTHTGPNGAQGDVTISSTLALDNADVQIVALDNSREETIRGVIHHSLPKAILSSLRLKIKVPGIAGVDPNKTVTIKMWAMGTVVATLPDLDASYHVLIAPIGAALQGPIPIGDVALATTSLIAIDAALKYFNVSLPAIAGVPAGSILHVSITRSGNTDGYTGDVGLLYLTADIS